LAKPSVASSKPVYLLSLTVLVVLLLVASGFSALDPDFGSRGRQGPIARIIFELIPKPVMASICWITAVCVLWASWQPLWYRWKGKSRFVYNRFGFAGLAYKPGLLSPFVFARYQWGDVTSVEGVYQPPSHYLPNGATQILIKCRVERVGARPWHSKFVFTKSRFPIKFQKEFLTLLAKNQLKLKTTVESILAKLDQVSP